MVHTISLIAKLFCEVGITISQMWKLSHGAIKWLIQGHIASNQENSNYIGALSTILGSFNCATLSFKLLAHLHLAVRVCRNQED